MLRWVTYAAMRTVVPAVPVVDFEGAGVDVYLYISTQEAAVPCVQAEWLQLREQVDVLFGRKTDLSKLRNRSTADAERWARRFRLSVSEVDTRITAVSYRPAEHLAIGANFSIRSALEPVHIAQPCTGRDHLMCNGADAPSPGVLLP